MEDVFFFPLNAINIYYKKVMIAILSLPITGPRTFLAVLSLFASLALMDGRLLEVLFTKYINRGSVSGFILSGVILLLFCRPVPLETLYINFVDI